jgi:hypothetical protein
MAPRQGPSRRTTQREAIAYRVVHAATRKAGRQDPIFYSGWGE